MKKVALIVIPVVICFLVGFAGAHAQTMSLETWYPTLVKSPLTPPDFVFSIAWRILYLLMGISIGLILISKAPNKRFLVIVFIMQLFCNWLWSILFFKMQNPTLAFINVLVLDILVLLYAFKSYRVLPAASLLFWPYAIWILFASYLNFYIMVSN